jgi:hypothetical protein
LAQEPRPQAHPAFLRHSGDITKLPGANGNKIYLAPTDASSIFNGHSIDNVIKSLEK